jgi:hypothetical protein
MKKQVLCVGIFIVASIIDLIGSTVYFHRSTPGAGATVIAIKLEDSELKPVVLGWPAIGIDSQVVVKGMGTISSQIPSILLGNNSGEVAQGDHLLYIDGRDILSYTIVFEEVLTRPRWELALEGQWIKSRWINWVYAADYPRVFSAEKGWLYVENQEEEKYWIYSYAEGSWEYMDLSLWMNSPMIHFPELQF